MDSGAKMFMVFVAVVFALVVGVAEATIRAAAAKLSQGSDGE